MELNKTAEDVHVQLSKITIATIRDSQLQSSNLTSKNTSTISRKSLQPVEIQLVTEGNVNELPKVIDLAQIDHKYQLGFTLLHYAVKENKLEVIEYLVSSGCDINAVDDEGQTPLHKSTVFGHAESAKLLIDKGANVNQIDNNGDTPLHVAIKSGGDFNVVKVLIEKANLGIQNNDEQNVLHVAVRYHKVDSINFILNHKQAPALITTTDKDGLTPIHLAVSLGYFDTTEKLLKRPQITIFGNTIQGKNIIHLAAANSNAILLSLLLDSFNTLHLINEADNKLCTPLHDAADKGRLKQVEILLDRGAMIKSTVDGFSPLHYACLQGHLSVAKKLIERHPFQSTNLFTNNKDTPLHLAARSGHAAIVKFLLDSGMSITHNSQQASFLDLALFNRDYEVANVAVKHKRWQECLDLISPIHPAPMVHLIQNIPEVAQVVMDHSITSAQLHSTHPSYWKQYDFKYILDVQKDNVITKHRPHGILQIILYYFHLIFSLNDTANTEPLKVIRTMIKYKRNKLFTHLLLLTFLSLKWVKYGRLYIQIRAAILVMLTLLLTVLISISDPPRSFTATSEDNNTKSNNDIDGNISQPLVNIILLTDAFYFIIITIQVIFFIRLRKIFHPVHFSFEVGAAIFTVVFAGIDSTESSKWLAAVGALICSWVALSLFSRYFDVFGLYTIMFYELLFKIVKVLLVGLYYIIGFGLILYILIGEEFFYNNPIKAVYATFSAAISRLDIGILARKEIDDTLQHPLSTYVVVLVFNVVVSITLINLLIGIAVQRIGAIQESALLYQAELKTQLFLELDPIMPKFLQPKIFPTKHKIKGCDYDASRIGSIWNRFTTLFAYSNESQESEAMTDQMDYETQELVNRIHQMENQINCMLNILSSDSKK